MAPISTSLEQTQGGVRIKPTKTGKSRRIPLPALAVEALTKHLEDQREHQRQFRGDYKNLGLVFASPDGDYLMPDSVTAKACLLAKRAGLKGIGLHSLRHSRGSQLLSAGVPLPTVSKRLGHSNVVTASIYSHAFTKVELAAADVWDTAMRNSRAAKRVQQ